MVVWVQILRALAAVAVTFAHAHNAALGLDIGDYVPDFQIGAAGVDLFFVISGFVMVQASAELFGAPRASIYFLLRRLARIAPIYWIATALFLFTNVYLMVGFNLAPTGFSARNILMSLLFIPDPRPNGAIYPVLSLGWTLNFEMFFYLVFSVSLFFRARIAIPLLAIAMTIYGQIMWHLSLPMPLGYWSNPIIIEFVFGMLISWIRLEGFRLPNWLAAMAAGAGLVWFVASAASFWVPGPRELWWGLPTSTIVTREFWWGLPAAALVAGAGLARRDLNRRQPVASFMVFLGDSSYALYLFHPAALVWPAQLIRPTMAPHLFFVLMLVSAIAASIAIHIMIERPITRLLQKRIERWRYVGKSRSVATE